MQFRDFHSARFSYWNEFEQYFLTVEMKMNLGNLTKENWMQMEIGLPCGTKTLNGNLHLPRGTKSLIMFVHGSGSNRLSPRNALVCDVLNEAGLGTFLFDLLTPEEEVEDRHRQHLRFDIDFLAERTLLATEALRKIDDMRDYALGYFGASTGAAAALQAAATLGAEVKAVVSRGGRPDMADKHLAAVKAPTLLIVGQNDREVLRLNKIAFNQLKCVKRISIIENATHLFEEPGTLDQVADLAAEWFSKYLV